MKFSEFCQKNAVSVALLASIIALGFIAWDMNCPEKKSVTVQTGRHYDFRERFIERYRTPRRSEAYKEKYRELTELLAIQVKNTDAAYKSGNGVLSEMLKANREYIMARIELARMENDSRISLGAIEAMAEIHFLKRLLADQERAYQAGAIPISEINATRIAITRAELNLLSKERALRHNEAFTKLAGAVDWANCDDATLKALIEAETTIPEKREK